jgi:hypothetical protein
VCTATAAERFKRLKQPNSKAELLAKTLALPGYAPGYAEQQLRGFSVRKRNLRKAVAGNIVLAQPTRARTPLRDLWPDIGLLLLGVLAMVLFWALDYKAIHPDWFLRSGSVAVLFSGILAYRSLGRHYQKFFNNTQRHYALKTSRNQLIIDYATVALSVVGTLVWGYGDKLW